MAGKPVPSGSGHSRDGGAQGGLFPDRTPLFLDRAARKHRGRGRDRVLVRDDQQAAGRKRVAARHDIAKIAPPLIALFEEAG